MVDRPEKIRTLARALALTVLADGLQHLDSGLLDPATKEHQAGTSVAGFSSVKPLTVSNSSFIPAGSSIMICM